MDNKKTPWWRKALKKEERDIDEFAADDLELGALADEDEDDEEDEGIGESEYFSTCDFTMIPTDDDTINSQGS